MLRLALAPQRRAGARAYSFLRSGKEVQVSLPSGLRMAGLSFGDAASPRKVLGLHGWMDNATTHAFTAEPWVARGYHFVSMDLLGHGRSDHRAGSDGYWAGSYALNVLELLDALKWDAFALCSHSMGAGISSMAAAAAPDFVTAMVSLEGLGMNTKDASAAASALTMGYAGRLSLAAKLRSYADKHGASAAAAAAGLPHHPRGAGKTYPNAAAAARARVATVERYPGKQSIALEAAEVLISRGTAPVHPGGTEASGAEAPVRFIHDPRLMEPSPVYLTEAQMRAYLGAVSAPTCVVTGTQGWPWPLGYKLGRVAALPSLELHHIVGGHHCHLDPDTGPVVAGIIDDFLDRHGEVIAARQEAALAKASTARAERAAAAVAAAAARAGQASAKPKAAALNLDSAINGTAATVGAPAAAGGDVDADLAAAASTIASNTASAGGAPPPQAEPAVPAPAPVRPPRLSPHHVFIAASASFVGSPVAASAAAAAAAEASGGRPALLQALPQVLVPLAVAPQYEALYAPSPLRPAAPLVTLAAVATTYVWQDLGDGVTGLPSALLGAQLSGGVRAGTWVPAVVAETLPTLEGVTADRSSLEAKGDAY